MSSTAEVTGIRLEKVYLSPDEEFYPDHITYDMMFEVKVSPRVKISFHAR